VDECNPLPSNMPLRAGREASAMTAHRVERRKLNLKAKFEGGSLYYSFKHKLHALSTWGSSVQPALPYQGRHRTLPGVCQGTAAQVESESKI